MFKAIHTLTGEEIVILHPRWRTHLDALREMDHADLLVCQGCRQPLRVKAGEFKRPHFAHKHLKACSYGTESPEILAARAVLYDWLLDQFHEGVTVEKQIADADLIRGLPRPVDCWVETERGIFAYWIVEAGIKLEPRDAIRADFARLNSSLNVTVHYIFLQSMLNEEKKEFHSLLLTPTERALLVKTPYDEMLSAPSEVGQTIHYLDAAAETLTTFRGLRLFHRPNWYKGFKKTSPLSDVRAGRLDGEPIHPGERDRLSAFRQQQLRREDRRKRLHDRVERYLNHTGADSAPDEPADLNFSTADSDAPPRTFLQPGPAPKKPHKVPASSQPELPCAICGQMTTDYWSTFYDESGRQLCRCRECLERGNFV